MSDEARPALFCSRPFSFFEISNHRKRGDVYLCCPSWLPKPVGNAAQQDLAEIWNGDAAVAIRRSILDGSFRHCSSHCAFLQSRSGPVQRLEDVVDPRLKGIIERQQVEVPLPQIVNAAFDRSCNLTCPSCRTEHIIEREAAGEIRKLQRDIEDQLLPHAELLYVSGSGDAFGSPFFLDWLRNLDLPRLPRLKIHLHTNAQLWTRPIWAKLPEAVRQVIETAEISIDAASDRTYQLNRRGGSWSKLMENLAFISELRAAGPLQMLKIHMLVQENNFEEMPAFVELGRRIGADFVYFSHLVSWGTFTPEELQRRSVHLKTHPRHAELQAVLAHPFLMDRRVDLGNLSSIATTLPELRQGSAA